ncbi:MAG: dual specificity protein phosphatase family protein [Deltaproteobacteria bacterium]|nr:dual specificity protein phosphatase family protein [Deltaproteobacteria bacterium]
MDRAEYQGKADSGYEAPFDDSYWVIPELFLAGAFPDKWKLRTLMELDFKHIIDLTEEKEDCYFGDYDLYIEVLSRNPGRKPIQHEKIPIAAFDTPDMATMTMILDKIDSYINMKEKVFVHCHEGIRRTGAVVGCFLMNHDLANENNVLNKIKQLRRGDYY